jgi:hypothetical protein
VRSPCPKDQLHYVYLKDVGGDLKRGYKAPAGTCPPHPAILFEEDGNASFAIGLKLTQGITADLLFVALKRDGRYMLSFASLHKSKDLGRSESVEVTLAQRDFTELHGRMFNFIKELS